MQRKIDRSSDRQGAVVQYAEREGTFGYVYAIGRLRAVFPSKDIEKEYQQLLTQEDLRATTEEQRLYNVLSRPENVFLAREMAWIFEIQDVATYVLQPRSSVELQAMLDAIKPDDPTQLEYDVIIGTQEPLPGVQVDLPAVVVNRLYHFTAKSFAESIPIPSAISGMPTGTAKDQATASFRAMVLAIFQDMLQMADNTGDADKHRALNYVSLNYPDIYALKWQPSGPGGASTNDLLNFTGVEVRHSPLSNLRKIMEVIFNYMSSSGVASRYYTTVDVTGQFPFLVTKLQPYFER
jgi:hypothetical protein